MPESPRAGRRCVRGATRERIAAAPVMSQNLQRIF
jgi:hypothetical protein